LVLHRCIVRDFICRRKRVGYQKKIAKKREGYTDVLKEKINEFLGGITEKFEKVKEEVTFFAGQGKTKSEKPEKDVKVVPK